MLTTIYVFYNAAYMKTDRHVWVENMYPII